MKKLLSTLAGSLLVLAAPTAAFSVNVSSDDGSGVQYSGGWYSCGGSYLNGNLRSTDGEPVYYNGAIVYDRSGDEQYGRYSGNVRSQQAQIARGMLGLKKSGCALPPDGAHVKVCRVKKLWPDPCGAWSQKIKSPWD